MSTWPSINGLIVVLRGLFARRGESRRLEIGGYRQWNWHILTIHNKLTNISEVYITFEIWSGLMVTCNKGLFSLRENIHAQDPYCVNIDWSGWFSRMQWVRPKFFLLLVISRSHQWCNVLLEKDIVCTYQQIM